MDEAVRRREERLLDQIVRIGRLTAKERVLNLLLELYERLEAIGRTLRAELTELSEPELQRAEAVLSYLHNILAYTTLREENGLSGEEIGEEIGWAIRTLIADLRKRNLN